jgi:hypothetical protein
MDDRVAESEGTMFSAVIIELATKAVDRRDCSRKADLRTWGRQAGKDACHLDTPRELLGSALGTTPATTI